MTSPDDWIDTMMPHNRVTVLPGNRVFMELPGCPGCCGSGANVDEALGNLESAMLRFFKLETEAKRKLPMAVELPRLEQFWKAKASKVALPGGCKC